jgi:cytochrome c
LLIEKSDCKTCHANDKTINGPAYNLVAQRYAGKSGIETTLIQKVIKGGTGNWGDRAMAAHPQLSEGEAGQMIKYILSLAGPKGENKAAISNLLSGVIDPKAEGNGNYVITAGYTDRGANGIAPLSAQQNLYLKSNIIQAFGVDMTSPHVTRSESNGVKNITMKNNDYLGLKDIDFKELKAIQTTYIASDSGRIELWIDEVENKGTKIGEFTMSFDPTIPSKENTGNVDLKLIKGSHPLFFVYRAKDRSNGNVTCRPLRIEFKCKEGL